MTCTSLTAAAAVGTARDVAADVVSALLRMRRARLWSRLYTNDMLMISLTSLAQLSWRRTDGHFKQVRARCRSRYVYK